MTTPNIPDWELPIPRLYDGQIFQPNYTWGNEFQSPWRHQSTACGRPGADYNVTIFCKVYSGSIGFIQDQGTEFMALAGCCPSNNGTNQYLTRLGCYSHFCYTSDTNIASNFSTCVRDSARVAAEKAKIGSAPNASIPDPELYFGRCEYIDYEMLKNGIVHDKVSGASVEKFWSVKAMMSVVGLGLLVVGSGML